MDFITQNWGLIAGVAVPALLALLWAVAQLTPWDWDNVAVRFARQAWGMIPVGQTDPEVMGRLPDNDEEDE